MGGPGLELTEEPMAAGHDLPRRGTSPRVDYLRYLLDAYLPLHWFAVFRAHELFSVGPYVGLLQPPVLDLGCGDGLVAQLLFGRPLEFGIDSSAPVAGGAGKSRRYRFVLRGSAQAIPAKGNSLGGVFSNCALEHMADLGVVIAEVARVLKPGGYFVATALAPQYYSLNPVFSAVDVFGLRWLRSRMIAAENALHNHVSVLSVEEYRALFAQSGMALVEHRYYMPRQLAAFCLKWDTLSKYGMPFPGGLSHSGLLVWLLRATYRRASRDVLFRQALVTRWHKRFWQACYAGNEGSSEGAGHVLVAMKHHAR